MVVSQMTHNHLPRIKRFRSILLAWMCLDQNEITIDDAFAFTMATKILISDGIKPHFIDECRCRTNWPKWKKAIQLELDSLVKHKVFGHVVLTPPNVKHVGYKWV